MRIPRQLLPLLLVFLLPLGCAKEMPNLGLTGPTGADIDLDSVAGDSDLIVLVVLVNNCPMSQAGARILKEFHQTNPEYTTVAGLLLQGDAERANKYRQDNELPYQVYGIDHRKDPLAFNELVKNVGSRRRAIFGGTIVVLDSNFRIRYSADGEKLRDVPARLERFVN